LSLRGLAREQEYRMLRQIALVSTTREVPLAEVAQTAAALQIQASRDLSQFWGSEACVSAFGTLSDIPLGYWPIVVSDDIPEPGAAGMHLDRRGNPYCLVECGPTWSLAASHECLEMLVDPSGDWQIWGPSPLPDQGEVGYLVEICDPCQDAQFGYAIDGVLVSDFCTPSFFEPAEAGARYSFTGAIERPLAALRNGYLSWFDPHGRGTSSDISAASRNSAVWDFRARPTGACANSPTGPKRTTAGCRISAPRRRSACASACGATPRNRRPRPSCCWRKSAPSAGAWHRWRSNQRR
jgi:hypothetical protein